MELTLVHQPSFPLISAVKTAPSALAARNIDLPKDPHQGALGHEDQRPLTIFVPFLGPISSGRKIAAHATGGCRPAWG